MKARKKKQLERQKKRALTVRVTKAKKLLFTAPIIPHREDYDQEADHREWLQLKAWLEEV